MKEIFNTKNVIIIALICIIVVQYFLPFRKPEVKIVKVKGDPYEVPVEVIVPPDTGVVTAVIEEPWCDAQF